MLRGTDISAHQSSAVPSGDFVIIKATEGASYMSSKLAAQWLDATRKGMLRATYHFPDYGNDPLDDAEHFCRTIAPLLGLGDNVVLDHEALPGTVSAKHAAAWGLKWLAYVENRLARRPWVYANVDWASSGYCAGMGAYPYWCADPSSPAGKPRVRGPFKTWVAHQYSWSGGLDKDVFNGDAAAWRALASGITPPVEEDVYGGQIPAGKGQQVNISFPRGRLSALGLVIDNTLAIDGVITPQPQAEVRVAIHRYTGTHQIETVKVGRAAADDKTVKTVVHFDQHENVDYVSLVRLDEGTTPVGWDMS
jgi:GH25 family lysozyme M1 (1,4-beta-N-acetylmuramidase)